jgi:biopolymer transport protein ExbB
VSARLWILDSIATVAPLLGLPRTIFGIMERFNALVATAMGIATALLGLLGNNVLNGCARVMTEDFKARLLSLTP